MVVSLKWEDTTSPEILFPPRQGLTTGFLTLSDLTFTYDAEGNIATQSNATSGEVRTFSDDHRNPLLKTDLRGTTAALEYGLLLKDLAQCSLAAKAVGDCVTEMLAAAAAGLQGEMKGVDLGYLSSIWDIPSDCAASGS
jgi:hypothetical protein